jgi:hypothetical protein
VTDLRANAIGRAVRAPAVVDKLDKAWRSRGIKDRMA